MNENIDRGLQKNVINWYPGHMAKTRREIKEKLNLIDIVYEVVDARMPLASKIIDIKELVQEKPCVLIMTKYDLCDKEETNKIIKFYEESGYQVIPVDLMHQLDIKKVLAPSVDVLKIENEKRKMKGLKPRVMRALILGVPNVGKSTLINRLVGKKAVMVGNRPGVTKKLGWIRINKDIELMDSPGILWPKFEDQEQAKILALLSSIKEEILEKDDLAIFALEKLSMLYRERVEERYGMSYQKGEDIEPILSKIAQKRGCLQKGGNLDYEKVYQLILQDIKSGAFGPITLDRIKN